MSDVWEQKHFNHFWQRMIESCGKRFKDEYGATPNNSWMEALRELTFSQVKYAIQEGARMGDDHPPTLAKFCYRARQYLQKSLPAHTEAPKLPKPEITPEQITANRERLRSLSKKKSGGRRCVFLQGESLIDYQLALDIALRNGVTEKEFKLSRMEKNGWTREMEKDFSERHPQFSL